MPRLDPAEVTEAARRLEHAPATDVLAWALDTFGKRCAIVTSFQVEGVVMLDLARQVDPGVRVITIDTGRLPEETYAVLDTVRARFDMEVEVITPDGPTLEAMVSRHGPHLFRRDRALRQLCYHVRKVEPLRRALEDLDAWVSGLRRDGGPARAGTAKVELDRAHGGIVKLNPLADWTREQALVHARAPARRGRARRALVVGGGRGPGVRPAPADPVDAPRRGPGRGQRRGRPTKEIASMTQAPPLEDRRNAVERAKEELDPLDIRPRIERYARDGYASIDPEDLKIRFRWWGLYTQRPEEAGYFMMRIRTPGGALTSDQLETIGRIAK